MTGISDDRFAEGRDGFGGKAEAVLVIAQNTCSHGVIENCLVCRGLAFRHRYFL